MGRILSTTSVSIITKEAGSNAFSARSVPTIVNDTGPLFTSPPGIVIAYVQMDESFSEIVIDESVIS